MRELVSICIGESGCRIGDTCWELLSAEHEINRDGSLLSDLEKHEKDNSIFFYETNNQRYAPRNIFIDLDGYPIKEIKNGTLKDLYNPNLFLNGKEGGGDLYPRGYYTIGKNLIEPFLETVRQLHEGCDKPQGFIIFNSICGGTGSGLGALINERLSVDYPKKLKLALSVFPSESCSNGALEIFNSLYAAHNMIEHTDLGIVLNNSALYDLYEKRIGGIDPEIQNINQLIAQFTSGFTCSFRTGGPLNSDLSEVATNLIVYPRIKFLVNSYSPFISQAQTFHQTIPVSQITISCLDSRSLMAKCNLSLGKGIACCLTYRGDVIPSEVNMAIDYIQSQNIFHHIGWVPKTFKIGINSTEPMILNNWSFGKTFRDACCIVNSTAIQKCFISMLNQWRVMYDRRAFIHWFIAEGGDYHEFPEVREDINALLLEYDEIQSASVFDAGVDEGDG